MEEKFLYKSQKFMISWRDRESQNLPWCPRPFYWVWKASWSSYGLRSVVGSSSPVGCSRIEILFTHFDKKAVDCTAHFEGNIFGGAYWGCLTPGLLEFASHESPHGVVQLAVETLSKASNRRGAGWGEVELKVHPHNLAPCSIWISKACVMYNWNC